MASISHRGFTHLGMDVSKDSILVAVLDPDRDDAPVDRIFSDDDSVRRLTAYIAAVTGQSGAESAIQKSHEALAAIITGNAEPFMDLYSHRDDATLANPWGPPVRGINDIRAAGERAASFYRDGEITDFERIGNQFTAELACILEIERFRAKLPGEAELTDVALRVTSVFRPEGAEWKLVHRHADLITTSRGPESIPRT